jgi:chromosome partitioning protein
MLEAAERELMSVPGAPYRLTDPLSHIANQYAAVVIDTRLSFSLLTEMALIAANHAIVPVKPRYLETVGLMSVIQKIQDIRDGWRVPNLQIGGVVVTKMNPRVRGHQHLVEQIKQNPTLSNLLLAVIPANEAVSYAHHKHQSLFTYDPSAAASKAYLQLTVRLLNMGKEGGV